MDMPVGVINCEELNDIDAGLIDINELIEKLEVVRKKYGVKSKIWFDAGYNNISAAVLPSKRKLCRKY